MKLIADCGSTKTAWMLTNNGSMIGTPFRTDGINPVRDQKDAIEQVISTQLMPFLDDKVEQIEAVYFYGAGCIDPFKQIVVEVLVAAFPEAKIVVESDLLGAAIALCGHHEGIACILGTGSNSCLYDGEGIISNVSPLGFILGDEGSGAVLGKLLVGNLLKDQLGKELKEAFFAEMSLSQADIINRVYRQPQANKFLASLVPFIVRHADNEAVKTMLIEAFRAFFRRNVANYGRRDLPINFVGGIANQFQSELSEAAHLEGFSMGQILKDPIEKMAEYHCLG